MTRAVTLLLAEDNQNDVVLISKAFEGQRGLNILGAVENGEELLAYLRQEGAYRQAARPDLVLMDIKMPGKNGLEALKEIKADPALRDLPVIMLSTSDRQEDIAESYRSGACSYLVKPVEFQQFREIARVFELYWAGISRLPRP
ncbi:MAG: response regulator [Candidatus Omnitrophica bacterium]|nr:response regulator [Candidatus Omnitrophota bacterium]